MTSHGCWVKEIFNGTQRFGRNTNWPT